MDPTSIITNLAAALPALEGLLRAVLYVLGILLVIRSLHLALRRTEFGAQATSSARVIVTFVTGALLLAFPATVSTLGLTLFGTTATLGPEAIFAYGNGMLDPLANGPSRQAAGTFVLIIQLVGFIAIARGLLFLNLAASPGAPQSFGPGLTFLIAGALAVNFPLFFGMITNLFA